MSSGTERGEHDVNAMGRRRLLPHALAAVVALLGACTNTRIEGIPPEEARVRVEPPVDEIVRFERGPSVLSARQEDDGALLIEYGVDGAVYMAEASGGLRQNISTQSGWLPVYYLSPLAADAFTARAGSARALPHHGVDLWLAFRRAVIEALAPDARHAGVVLNYRDVESVWYRDASGALVRSDLKDKPPGIRITGIYRIEAMRGLLFDVMERTLAERGIGDRAFLVDTGKTGAYARPFVAVDMNRRDARFLSLEPFTFGSVPDSPIVIGGRLTDHILRSYVLEPVNRPFTMGARLFWFALDSMNDIIRRTWVERFGYARLAREAIPPLNTGPGMDLEAWEARLDDLAGPHRYAANIEVLVDGDQYFPRLIDSILSADDAIKMRTYIFDNDDYAVSIADLLKRRADEVDVRVMIDGLGTMMAERTEAGTAPTAYRAPLGITVYLKEASRLELRNLGNPWATGDHTKTTIIDSDHAYIGGMNIGREYRWEWHDMMMRVDGRLVAYIEREFDKAWAHASVLGDLRLAARAARTRPPESDAVAHPVRPLLTLPRRSEIYHVQIAAMRNARSYIYVQVPYLTDAVMINELAKARQRGVDVRVILPMEGNHGVMNANNVVAANRLLRYGVRVFAYPGMSHIKAAIYDGWACAGSANFDKLSFRVNKEMNIGSSDPDFVRQLMTRVFEPDFGRAVEVTQPLPSGWLNTFASIVASQL